MTAAEDFKVQYNRFWKQYHLIGRYLDCPEIDIEKKEKNRHKFNETELQLGTLIKTSRQFLGREMSPAEIELGFFLSWEL